MTLPHRNRGMVEPRRPRSGRAAGVRSTPPTRRRSSQLAGALAKTSTDEPKVPARMQSDKREMRIGIRGSGHVPAEALSPGYRSGTPVAVRHPNFSASTSSERKDLFVDGPSDGRPPSPSILAGRSTLVPQPAAGRRSVTCSLSTLVLDTSGPDAPPPANPDRKRVVYDRSGQRVGQSQNDRS